MTYAFLCGQVIAARLLWVSLPEMKLESGLFSALQNNPI